jgi:hypothetical protein
MTSRADERMALEATHSDRVVRDDVRQEPSPMDRVGGRRNQ